MRQYARAVLFTALLFFVALPALSGTELFQYRYLWVVRNALTNEQAIDKMVKFAAENGFNRLLVQVRGRGDALYNSQLVPRSELLTHSDFDPLAYVITQARDRGMEIHAWLNVYLAWSSKNRPRTDNHVYNCHQDWIDQRKYALETFLGDGQPADDEAFYLAPHHPQVNEHLLTVFQEIATLYDLDGLHLDYIRYRDADYGHNEGGRTLFSQQYQAGQNEDSWDDFRRAAVTDLVRETKSMLLDLRPRCRLSAAVKPNLLIAKNRYFQEWDEWLAAGYLDQVIPMNYTSDLRDFATNIDIINDHIPKKYRDRIMMGIALYNQEPVAAVEKLTYTEITRFKGIALFSYNVLLERPTYTATFLRLLNP